MLGNARTIGFAGLGLLMLLGARACAGESLPRYALTPGEKLVYKTSEIRTGSNLNSTIFETLEITVLHANEDGSWRLLERDTTEDVATYGDAKPRSGKSSEIKVLDIFSDGHVPGADNQEAAGSGIFPPLPPDEKAIQIGWKTQVNPIEEQDYRVVKDTGGELVESTNSSGLMDQVYINRSAGKIHFDRAKGIVTAIEFNGSQDYGFHFKSSGSTRLVSTEKVDAANLKRLSDDGETMRQAEKEESELWKNSQNGAKVNEQQIGEESQALFLAAASRVKTESIRAKLTTMAKQIGDSAAYDAEDDAKQAEFVGKPSPAWESIDLDGHKQSLAAYRGSVVLLDFWYRGCGFCMVAMPQVKQIAEEYKNKGVVVLAMNTDRDEADAKFVGQIFGLPYPIVKASDINKTYGIHEFPTLVIIDQKGIVRDFEVGYTKELGRNVKKEVDELLARK